MEFIAGLRQASDYAALPVGRRVVVIGGGMTAVDAAVQSRLLGAEDVLGAREGKLTGGCRAWTLPVTLVDAVAGAQVLASTAVTGWPTGAIPAQVCVGDKTFVVTLRPLVPGEKP